MENRGGPLLKMANGLTIPQVGFGTYQLRGQQCVSAVKWALQIGYRHIDTASVYRNAAEICTAIKQSGVKRQEIFITSKVGPKEHGYDEAIQSCENVLKLLETDYLDLLLIHWPGAAPLPPASPDNAVKRLETWKALIHLQQIGKVRSIGVSNFLYRHLNHLFANSTIIPVINQFQLHPLLEEAQTIELCKQKQILIQAYSPLARCDKRLSQNPEIIKIALKYNKTVCQIAIKCSIQKGFIVLPKSKTEKYIKQNFFVWDFKLSEQEIKLIDELKITKLHTCWDPNVVLI